MKFLNVFVCENFARQAGKVIKENFDDVLLRTFPCICEDKLELAKTQKMLQQEFKKNSDGFVMCGQECVLGLSKNVPYDIIATKYCHKYFADEEYLRYLALKGTYIIPPTWLMKTGTVKKDDLFGQNAKINNQKYKEIVIFYDEISEDIRQQCKKSADFLQLPCLFLTFDTSFIEYVVKCNVYAWRLENKNKELDELKLYAQDQGEQYSAIIDKIIIMASYTSRRIAIGEIKKIFKNILGARTFKYYDFETENDGVSEEVKKLFLDAKENSISAENKDRFLVKITNKDRIFGIIETGNFIDSAYMEQNLNLALQISKVCGLILYYIEQYEYIIKSEKKLLYLSYHDSMTDLYNRTYINEVLKKNKVEQDTAVFIFDIDHLKYVNDHYGHLQGDEIIKNVAHVLKNNFRESDSVARIGGDEFMVLIPKCGEQTANMFLERLRQAFEKQNKKQTNEHLKLSISAGYAIANEQQQEYGLEALMQEADEHMYENKLIKRKLTEDEQNR